MYWQWYNLTRPSLPCFSPRFPPSYITLLSSSISRTRKMKPEAIIQDCFCYKEETQLTVRKTCLFYSGDGFSVYDSKGLLIFRVDSYGPDTQDRDEVVLMDAVGKCLLTVHKKKPSLHHRWEGFIGERTEGDKPIFSVRRSSIIKRCSVMVVMYNDLGEEYQIDGSFTQRTCTIYKIFQGCTRQVVGEIKRKVDSTTNVLLGQDVFSLCLKPGFDSAFAMGLVLVLDQIDEDTAAVNPDVQGISHDT